MKYIQERRRCTYSLPNLHKPNAPCEQHPDEKPKQYPSPTPSPLTLPCVSTATAKSNHYPGQDRLGFAWFGTLCKWNRVARRLCAWLFSFVRFIYILPVVVDCPFALFYSILLCECATIDSSMLLLMGVWVVSRFGLL